MQILNNPLARPLGFKLLKGGLTEELLFTKESTYNELRSVLIRKVNQCNFHKYYRAEKKIGEGNFAKVVQKKLLNFILVSERFNLYLRNFRYFSESNFFCKIWINQIKLFS